MAKQFFFIIKLQLTLTYFTLLRRSGERLRTFRSSSLHDVIAESIVDQADHFTDPFVRKNIVYGTAMTLYLLLYLDFRQ